MWQQVQSVLAAINFHTIVNFYFWIFILNYIKQSTLGSSKDILHKLNFSIWLKKFNLNSNHSLSGIFSLKLVTFQFFRFKFLVIWLRLRCTPLRHESEAFKKTTWHHCDSPFILILALAAPLRFTLHALLQTDIFEIHFLFPSGSSI